jgi:hypothetical protein
MQALVRCLLGLVVVCSVVLHTFLVGDGLIQSADSRESSPIAKLLQMADFHRVSVRDSCKRNQYVATLHQPVIFGLTEQMWSVFVNDFRRGSERIIGKHDGNGTAPMAFIPVELWQTAIANDSRGCIDVQSENRRFANVCEGNFPVNFVSANNVEIGSLPVFQADPRPLIYVKRQTHHAQLSLHSIPLEQANNDSAETPKDDGGCQADHPTLGAFNAIFNVLYLALYFLTGYALCCLAGWVIWRRWRVDRLATGTLLCGLLTYGVAGTVVWHGFIVLQKLLDNLLLL